MKKKRVIIFALVSALSFASRQSALTALAAGVPGGIVTRAGNNVLTDVDWMLVDKMLDEAIQGTDGQSVNIHAGNEIEFSADALKKIAGLDVVLAMHTGDGLAFSVNGREVSDTIDKTVKISLSMVSSIPDPVKGSVLVNSIKSREFKMEEKEDYPCRINMHVAFESEDAGKLAVLYYYDNARGVMKAEGFFRINDTGHAMFELPRGDEYLIAVMDNYTVLSGDSLSGIASKSGVTIQALMAANPHISNADEIRVGQSIYIPV